MTVRHTFTSTAVVTSVLHAGDTFISLSGLDVEPKRDDLQFALVPMTGLPVSSVLDDGISNLLENLVSRMCLADAYPYKRLETMRLIGI